MYDNNTNVQIIYKGHHESVCKITQSKMGKDLVSSSPKKSAWLINIWKDIQLHY